MFSGWRSRNWRRTNRNSIVRNADSLLLREICFRIVCQEQLRTLYDALQAALVNEYLNTNEIRLKPKEETYTEENEAFTYKDSNGKRQVYLFKGTDEKSNSKLKEKINSEITSIMKQIIDAAYNYHVNANSLPLSGFNKNFRNLAEQFSKAIEQKLEDQIKFNEQNILPITIKANNDELKTIECKSIDLKSPNRTMVSKHDDHEVKKDDPEVKKYVINPDNGKPVYIAKGFGDRDTQEDFCARYEIGADRIESPAKFLQQLYLTLGLKTLKHVGGGTTHATAYIAKDKIYVANIGDSSVFLSTKKGIQQLNIHHKAQNKNEQERVKHEGGIIRPVGRLLRLNGVLAITRSYGDRYHRGISFTPTITSTKRPTTDDAYVVLCSDGITDNLTAAEIQKIILDSSADKNIADEIRAAAYQKGAQKNTKIDNMVVIVAPANSVGSLFSVFDGHHDSRKEANVAEQCAQSLGNTIEKVLANKHATLIHSKTVVKSIELSREGPRIEFLPIQYEQFEKKASSTNSQLHAQPVEVDDDNDSEFESDSDEDNKIRIEQGEMGSSTGQHARDTKLSLEDQYRKLRTKQSYQNNTSAETTQETIRYIQECWKGTDKKQGYGEAKWYDVTRPYLFYEIDRDLESSLESHDHAKNYNMLARLQSKIIKWLNQYHSFESSLIPGRRRIYENLLYFKIQLNYALQLNDKENDENENNVKRSGDVFDLLVILYQKLNTVRNTTNSSGVKLMLELFKDHCEFEADGIRIKNISKPYALLSLIQDEAISRNGHGFKAVKKPSRSYLSYSLFGKKIRLGRSPNIDHLYAVIAKTNLFLTPDTKDIKGSKSITLEKAINDIRLIQSLDHPTNTVRLRIK